MIALSAGKLSFDAASRVSKQIPDRKSSRWTPLSVVNAAFIPPLGLLADFGKYFFRKSSHCRSSWPSSSLPTFSLRMVDEVLGSDIKRQLLLPTFFCFPFREFSAAGRVAIRHSESDGHFGTHSWLDSAIFGSLTSPKRQRVNTLRLIHSLALRACILNAFREHGAVQLANEFSTASARLGNGNLRLLQCGAFGLVMAGKWRPPNRPVDGVENGARHKWQLESVRLWILRSS